jgi:hypothetical protein
MVKRVQPPLFLRQMPLSATMVQIFLLHSTLDLNFGKYFIGSKSFHAVIATLQLNSSRIGK